MPTATPPAQLSSAAYELWNGIAQDMSTGRLNFVTFAGASLGVQVKLRNKDLSTEELTRIVGTEPLLSARVVALANSAAMNACGKAVTDLRSAVLRVGHNSVWMLALSIALDQMSHAKDIAAFREQARQIWSHSVEVAAIAQVLARRRTRLNPSDAMFAGLVHDIGYYYLMQRAAQVEILAAHPEELKALVFDWHPAVGAAVLQTLGVPDAISTAVDEHELEPARVKPDSLSHVLAIADRCAKVRNPLAPTADEALAARRAQETGLDEETARAVVAEAEDEVRSLLSALRP
jgi:putative nucleotidyltransferase with HDIG domain